MQCWTSTGYRVLPGAGKHICPGRGRGPGQMWSSPGPRAVGRVLIEDLAVKSIDWLNGWPPPQVGHSPRGVLRAIVATSHTCEIQCHVTWQVGMQPWVRRWKGMNQCGSMSNSSLFGCGCCCLLNCPPTFTGARHQWRIPISRGHF